MNDAEELRRLRRIVAALPHTLDGVPATPGAIVMCPKGHRHELSTLGKVYCVQGDCYDDGCQGDSGSGTRYRIEQCKHESSAANKSD